MFFLLALPLTAHGMEPDYDRYVTNREVHFLLPCGFLMAAAGLRWLRGRMPAVLAVTAAPAVLVFLVTFAYEGYATKRILDQSVNEGNLQLDFALAQMLSTRLGPDSNGADFRPPLASGADAAFFGVDPAPAGRGRSPGRPPDDGGHKHLAFRLRPHLGARAAAARTAGAGTAGRWLGPRLSGAGHRL